MTKRQGEPLRRELTPEEEDRWRQAWEDAEREKEPMPAKGRQIKAARNHVRVAVRDALMFLKAERHAQGLSLGDVEKRSGMGPAAVSRLENETETTPTLLTLTRYAQALGKRLVVSFE